jgi:hypothetical protein
MCSIYIDESTIHMSTATRPSRLYVLFSEMLGSLLDRLDNQRTMHDF